MRGSISPRIPLIVTPINEVVRRTLRLVSKHQGVPLEGCKGLEGSYLGHSEIEFVGPCLFYVHSNIWVLVEDKLNRVATIRKTCHLLYIPFKFSNNHPDIPSKAPLSGVLGLWLRVSDPIGHGSFVTAPGPRSVVLSFRRLNSNDAPLLKPALPRLLRGGVNFSLQSQRSFIYS